MSRRKSLFQPFEDWVNGLKGWQRVLAIGVAALPWIIAVEMFGHAARTRPDPEFAETARNPDAAGDIVCRGKNFDSAFSPWDGSNTVVVGYVKDKLQDRHSFKHIRTIYACQADGLHIKMTYSATNAFGQRVFKVAVARYEKSEGTYYVNADAEPSLTRPIDE
jgi:hypothetical protein